MGLKWRGNEVLKKAEQAAMIGVNKTMADCVIQAKSNHPFQNRTSTLEGSVRIVEIAKKTLNAIIGVWGSVDVEYAIHIELGTRFHTRSYSFLRPAADVVYPRLARNIREAFASL